MEQKQKQEPVAEFEFADLMGITMTLVVVGIGITYGLVVQSEVRADIDHYVCATGYTWNKSAVNYTSEDCYLNNGSDVYATHTGVNPAYTGATDSINATAKISSKLGMIVTVIVAAVIIGILVRYLWVKFN